MYLPGEVGRFSTGGGDWFDGLLFRFGLDDRSAKTGGGVWGKGKLSSMKQGLLEGDLAAFGFLVNGCQVGLQKRKS